MPALEAVLTVTKSGQELEKECSHMLNSVDYEVKE
jgi:hypothetical protein